MKHSIRFINHACISISLDEGGEILLTDPWFNGDVFNHSWGMLVDTDLSLIDWGRVRYIWISHEHPDHLNFPSLKEVRSRVQGEIKVFFRAQRNKNVKDALSKMGFTVVELEPEVEFAVSDKLSITTYWNRQDTAAVFRCGDRVIVNQNDCQLTPRTAAKLKRRFPHIDVLLFQFSLAGYYANPDDARGLRAAQLDHLSMIAHYVDLFDPRVYVPFASFVYFSKAANCFLNQWAVRLEDVVALPQLSGKLQLCVPGDTIQSVGGLASEGMREKLQYWADCFEMKREFKAPKPVDEADIVDAGRRFLAEVTGISFKFMRPSKMAYFLQDIGRYLVVDYKREECSIAKVLDGATLAGSLPAEELLFFLKFPWGADTLNITSTFRIDDMFSWRWSNYIKHLLYVVRPKSLRYFILPVSFLFAKIRTRKAKRNEG